MSQIYNISNYYITCSLNESIIHIKIINNITYLCYEGNFDKNIYDVLIESFSNKDCEINDTPKFIKLKFKTFEIMLKYSLLSTRV